MDKIKFWAIIKVIRTLYDMILRPALLEYVQSTANNYDDMLVNYIDLIIYSDFEKKE
jgi:hypothetical protein